MHGDDDHYDDDDVDDDADDVWPASGVGDEYGGDEEDQRGRQPEIDDAPYGEGEPWTNDEYYLSYSSSLYLTKTCWCDEQLVFVWYIPNSGVEHWDSKWITASLHRRGNCFCCIWKVLNSPEGTPAPEPAKPLKTVW